MIFLTRKHFLSDRQINNAVDEVNKLRHLWYEAEPDRQKDLDGRLHVLGGCTYLSTAHLQHREHLINSFSWLYAELKVALEDITKKRCQFSRDLPLPGFHISELKQDITQDLHFHVDSSVLDYSNSVKLSDVMSVLVLLQDSKDGAYLSTDLFDHKYDVGALHIWSGGTTLHRMGGLEVDDHSRRITMQCHYYYDHDLDVNIIYF